jgi:hypothetical protein
MSIEHSIPCDAQHPQIHQYGVGTIIRKCAYLLARVNCARDGAIDKGVIEGDH